MKKIVSLAAAAAFALGLAGCADGRSGLHNAVVKPLSIEGDVSGVMEGGDSGTRAQLTMLTGETDFDNAMQEYAFTYSSSMTGWGGSGGTINFKIMASSSGWLDDWGAPKDETITLTVQEELADSELEGKDPVDVYSFTKLYLRGSAEASGGAGPGNIVVNDLSDGEDYKILVRYYPLTDETSIAIVGTVANFPSLTVQTKDGESYEMTRKGSTYEYVFDEETAAGTREFLIASAGTPPVYWSTESAASEGGESATASLAKPGFMTFSYESGKQYFVSVSYDMETNRAVIAAGQYDTSILGKAGVIGGFDGWAKSVPFTKVDDKTYTYDFTANATEIEFAIQEQAGSWSVGRWFKGIPADTADRKKTDICDDIVAAKKDAVPIAVTPIYYQGDSGNDGQNLLITGLPYESGYQFRLTASIVDADKKEISLTVQALEDIPESAFEPPTEYSLEGLTLKGGWEGWWTEQFKLNGAAEQTYTTTVGEHEASENKFGIYASGGNLWEGTDIPFGQKTELTYNAAGGGDATMAENWEQGATYTIKLELTDRSLSAPKLFITITKN